MEKKKKTSGTVIFRHIICIILVLLALFPFYVLIINSTLESNVIKQGIHLLPGSRFFENYKNLMIKTNATSTVNLWQAMRNSTDYTSSGILCIPDSVWSDCIPVQGKRFCMGIYLCNYDDPDTGIYRRFDQSMFYY